MFDATTPGAGRGAGAREAAVGTEGCGVTAAVANVPVGVMVRPPIATVPPPIVVTPREVNRTSAPFESWNVPQPAVVPASAAACSQHMGAPTCSKPAPGLPNLPVMLKFTLPSGIRRCQTVESLQQ